VVQCRPYRHESPPSPPVPPTAPTALLNSLRLNELRKSPHSLCTSPLSRPALNQKNVARLPHHLIQCSVPPSHATRSLCHNHHVLQPPYGSCILYRRVSALPRSGPPRLPDTSHTPSDALDLWSSFPPPCRIPVLPMSPCHLDLSRPPYNQPPVSSMTTASPTTHIFSLSFPPSLGCVLLAVRSDPRQSSCNDRSPRSVDVPRSPPFLFSPPPPCLPSPSVLCVILKSCV